MLKNSVDKKDISYTESIRNIHFLSFSSYFLMDKSENALKEKHHSYMSLPILNGKLPVLFNKTGNFKMFFLFNAYPTSHFNKMIRNYLMPNKKIVELHVGEETNDLFYENIAIKFLSPKGEKEIRLAIETPNNMRSYTEEMRKKYFSEQKKDGDQKP